jgi:FlaA1/EpsC-like NDP-sugar epimerase
MLNNRALLLQPVGFVDDDPAKKNASIHGVRVIGCRSDLGSLIEKLNIDEVVIAMPSIGNGVVQEVIATCSAKEITHREVRGLLL